MNMFVRYLVYVAALLMSTPAWAEDFWFSPLEYQLESGQELIVHFRGGEDFRGPSIAFLPEHAGRFVIASKSGVGPLPIQIGERPALRALVQEEGLTAIALQGQPAKRLVEDWTSYIRTMIEKAYVHPIDDHVAMGYPIDSFYELHQVFARALFFVDVPDGADSATGMEFEIVAMDNPFLSEDGDEIRFKVDFQGEPLANAPLRLFERQLDEVKVLTLVSDADGFFDFPVKEQREYLIHATKMLPMEPKDLTKDPIWTVLTTSLVFATP